jgi:hypothetical protein
MSDYLETKLTEARLPEASCQRLRLAFLGTDNDGLKEAIHVEQRLAGVARPTNPMRQVTINLLACGEGFKAVIWVRESEYFHDGVLLESKLRNRLSCNMTVVFPIEPRQH